jgi:hypothetical protein
MKGLGAFLICVLDRSEDAADPGSRWRRMVHYGAVISPTMEDDVDLLAVVDPASPVERQAIAEAMTMPTPRIVFADELLVLADRGNLIDEQTVSRLDADFRASYRREEARYRSAFAAISISVPVLNHFRI